MFDLAEIKKSDYFDYTDVETQKYLVEKHIFQSFEEYKPYIELNFKSAILNFKTYDEIIENHKLTNFDFYRNSNGKKRNLAEV